MAKVRENFTPAAQQQRQVRIEQSIKFSLSQVPIVFEVKLIFLRKNDEFAYNGRNKRPQNGSTRANKKSNVHTHEG